MDARGTIRGFTLAETAVGLAVAALALAVAIRPAASYISHTRVNRAVAVVAADLERARAAAARQRQPVRVVFDQAAMRYTVTTRTGAVVIQRPLGIADSDFDLSSAQFTPAAVDLYPGGVASSGLTVSLTAGTYTRHVTMTRVGYVRMP